jgi:hypothetical protein
MKLTDRSMPLGRLAMLVATISVDPRADERPDAGDRRVLAALTVPGRLFRRGEPLALMPFAFVR